MISSASMPMLCPYAFPALTIFIYSFFFFFFVETRHLLTSFKNDTFQNAYNTDRDLPPLTVQVAHGNTPDNGANGNAPDNGADAAQAQVRHEVDDYQYLTMLKHPSGRERLGSLWICKQAPGQQLPTDPGDE